MGGHFRKRNPDEVVEIPKTKDLQLPLQDAMHTWFSSNTCIGKGDVRAVITTEALQRTEMQDTWEVSVPDPFTNRSYKKKMYRADVMEFILDFTAMGYSLPKLLSIEGMPKARTIINWIHDYKPFANLLEIAEQMRAIVLSEEALVISDEDDPTGGRMAIHQRNRIDIRMRIAESIHARRYGKKQLVDVTHHEELGGSEVWTRLASVLSVHRETIEANTGIRITLPAQDAEILSVTPDETPTLTMGIQGEQTPGVEEDKWSSGKIFEEEE